MKVTALNQIDWKYPCTEKISIMPTNYWGLNQIDWKYPCTEKISIMPTEV